MGIDVGHDEIRGPERKRFGQGAAVLFSLVALGLIVWVTQPPSGEDPGAGQTTDASPGSSIARPRSSTTPSTSSSPPRAATMPHVVSSRPAVVGELVPGWSETLYAVVGSHPTTFVTWESERTEGQPFRTAASLPEVAVGYELDVSGELFAFAVSDPDDEAASLHVMSRDRPVVDFDLRVTSLAWHASQPGRLAVVAARPDGTSHLVVLTFEDLEADRAGAQSIADVDSDTQIRSWNEHGFVTWSGDGQGGTVGFLDPSGELQWQLPGGPVAVFTPRGEVLVNRNLSERFEFVVASPDGPEGRPVVELPVSGVTNSGWSPDGKQLALLFYEGTGKPWILQIYDRQGVLVDSVSFDWRVWDLTWSIDQRFLLMPGTDDEGTHALIVYDTETGLTTLVGFTTWVHWAASRR